MARVLIVLIFMSSFAFAISEDTKVLIELIKSETKANRDLIRANQEATNKRFEAVDKRFEDMQKYMDNRFEAMDKRFESMQKSMDSRFEAMDKRFESMQKSMDNRFKAVDKRFEDMQKYMDSRFNMITTFLGLLFTAMVGGFSAIMWYLVKERRDIRVEIEQSLERELEKKADVKFVDNIMNILEKFAQKNRDIAEILSEHQVKVN